MNNLIIASTHKEHICLWLEALSSHYPVIFMDNIEKILAQEKQDDNRILLVLDVTLISRSNQLPLLCQHFNKVIVVGENFTPSQQIRFIYDGACGYSEKLIDKQLILHTIESVLNDEIWLTRQFVFQMLKKMVNKPNLQGNIENEIYKSISILTKREIEVVEHVFNGEDNAMIAEKLNISVRMVKGHLSATFKKLNVHDKFHLVVFLKNLIIGKTMKVDKPLDDHHDI